MTVPGAAGWLDAIELWGSGNVNIAGTFFNQLSSWLKKGFLFPDTSAHLWREALKLVKQSGDNANMFVNEDGSFVRLDKYSGNVPLARIFRLIAQYGKRGFW